MARKAKARWSTFTDAELAVLRKALYDFGRAQGTAYSEASLHLFTQIPLEHFGIDTTNGLRDEVQGEQIERYHTRGM